MITLYVSSREIPIISVDGYLMTVKVVLVREASGFISLQELKSLSNLKDVEIVLIKRFFYKKLQLSSDVKEAILYFLRSYHAKQDIGFDCYAFANLVKGVEVHKVTYMRKYWDIKPLPWRVPIGSVIFFFGGDNYFHHAAVYIGFGLYISVWGAGGDLEISTFKSIKCGYGAKEAVLAFPKEIA